MATKITQEDIRRMNILYLSIGTYAGVAREMGVAPGTVKRYIVPDFHEVAAEDVKHFYIIDLPEEPNAEPFLGVENFGDLCEVTEEEEEELKDLWNEMEL